MDPRWKHPFTSIFAGPTKCGKSFFTLKFLSEASTLITPPPERVIYCYGEYQDIFAEHPQIEFAEGLPDFRQFDGKERVLLILDDLLRETNDDVEKLFTKGSHHRNISVIFLSQNLFYKNKQNRTMSLNAHYLVLFKNPRDVTQVSTLARQMYPDRSRFLVEAFRDATAKPYGYLLIDLTTDMEEMYRIRTNIFSNEWHIVYVPK